MITVAHNLQSLVTELKKIDLNQSEEAIISQVQPLLKNTILNSDEWMEDRFYKVDEAQGFGSHLIYENPDHTLAVIITSWPTRRETPPHDHGTWAVIGCVKGSEKNTLWDRHDDGKDACYADISRGRDIMCKPGDIVIMKTPDIHTVSNPADSGVSISLHVYGKHFNYTNRKQFDPITKTAKPFIVRQE